MASHDIRRLGFEGLGFRVSVLGFRVYGLGVRRIITGASKPRQKTQMLSAKSRL